MKKLLLILALTVAFSSIGYSQTDFGLWNDVQVTKPVTKTVDIVAGVRFDTKSDTAKFAEQRIYAGLTLKNKTGRFTVQPMVLYLKNFSKVPYYETRLQLTTGYRFTANKVNITPKVRLEYHNKYNLKNDGRVVPLITFDRKISKHYSVFNTDEFWIPLYNTKDVTKYRKRLFFGVTRTVNKNLSIDLFYLYQRDEQVNPKNTHKIGLTWKIKL